MQALVLDNLPTPVLLVWDRGHVVVDGYGQYCPNCNKDQLFDSNALCVACGGHSAAGDFCSDEFNDEEYEKGKIKLYELIGKLSELTEEQAKELVDYFTTDEDFGNEDVFRDYLGKAFYNTALESFHSAIEAEGYHLTNPIPFPRSDIDGTFLDDYEIREYTSAQSKTLPANTLIFKRS